MRVLVDVAEVFHGPVLNNTSPCAADLVVVRVVQGQRQSDLGAVTLGTLVPPAALVCFGACSALSPASTRSIVALSSISAALCSGAQSSA